MAIETIVKCDVCGKELNIWYEVATSIGGTSPYANMADMMAPANVPVLNERYSPRTFALCKDCGAELMRYAVERKETFHV